LPHNRAAIDPIRGYFYQFDYYILKLLEAQNDLSTVCIEGIEDVDINTTDETVAIQCKYYEKTKYNHSLLIKPIYLMLQDYIDRKKKRKPNIKYVIYGYYLSGQEKLPTDIDVKFFKKHFLTRSGCKLYEELNLSDKKLISFIQNLTINIYAPSFDEQVKKIYDKLNQIFNCFDFEADYFYNNALREVKELSTKRDEKDRTIKRKDFISRIDKKDILFNSWFLRKKGKDKYCKSIKRQYFTINNISPYERFFLIKCDDLITDLELKTLLQNISKNWSKSSQRSKDTFCPYVYLHNISDDRLIRIKEQLQFDDFCFIDGYDFKGANFSISSICKKVTFYNNIKLKIVSEIEQIDGILKNLTSTREIYQFFTDGLFYKNNKHRHIKIFIEKTNNINEII